MSLPALLPLSVSFLSFEHLRGILLLAFGFGFVVFFHELGHFSPPSGRRVVWILTPLLSLTQGSLAAIVLYFVFRAGLLRGLIFPDFTLPFLSGPHLRSPMDELLHGELPSVIEAAKLLIWSLVAGTAERLVPDLLTRLSDQATKSQLASEKST
jgi:hypothetical protein